MRGSRGITGRDIQQVVHFPESSKPDPIVPKRLIEGSRNASTASAGRRAAQRRRSRAGDPPAGRQGRPGDRDLLSLVVSASATSAGSRRWLQQIAPDLS